MIAAEPDAVARHEFSCAVQGEDLPIHYQSLLGTKIFQDQPSIPIEQYQVPAGHILVREDDIAIRVPTDKESLSGLDSYLDPRLQAPQAMGHKVLRHYFS